MSNWKEFGITDNPMENFEERVLDRLLAKDESDADRSEIFRRKYKRFLIGGLASLVLGAVLIIPGLVMNKPLEQIGVGLPFMIYRLIALAAYLEVMALIFEWTRPIANFYTILMKVFGILFAFLPWGDVIYLGILLLTKVLLHAFLLYWIAQACWWVFPLPFVVGFFFYRKMMRG
ncbi:MAG: hypothetical protein LIO86_02345 [Lachnospiraceae bacterium]|nr:hypothetical protein [Lachnospiraceae bacterium]